MGMEREVPEDWMGGRQRQEESILSESNHTEEWVSDHSFALTDNFRLGGSFNVYPQDEEDW